MCHYASLCVPMCHLKIGLHCSEDFSLCEAYVGLRQFDNVSTFSRSRCCVAAVVAVAEAQWFPRGWSLWSAQGVRFLFWLRRRQRPRSPWGAGAKQENSTKRKSYWKKFLWKEVWRSNFRVTDGKGCAMDVISHSPEISQPRDLTGLIRRSRAKASFSHLGLSLALLAKISCESFVLTSWTFTFWTKSRTKASFSHLRLSDFEGSLARKLCFHIFHLHFLREVFHESFVFKSSPCRFEGGLARKLRFHIFHFHFLREVLHESFVFTSSAFTFWGKPGTKCVFER